MSESVHTYGDEGLIEAVEAQVPDEPPADEGRNEPQVEVGDHQERSAAHHPEEGDSEFLDISVLKEHFIQTIMVQH